MDEGTFIPNYSAFIMNGDNMSPTINKGDHIVVDNEQRAIRSGEIYLVGYKKQKLVCRLLLDRQTVLFVFDALDESHEESIDNINVIGRVIEVKTLALD